MVLKLKPNAGLSFRPRLNKKIKPPSFEGENQVKISLYKLKAYLKHLLKATNQHGVHSPFVYRYVSECLYRKSKFKGSKSTKVLLKSISFFSIKNLEIVSKGAQIENRIQKEFGQIISHEGPFDLIYLDSPSVDILSIHQSKINNDSILLIENIYGNLEATAIWKSLKQNEMVTVSLDLFYCGILFFRKEQVKEHFKIRI